MLDVCQIPSSITAHGPGYIDRDNEVIVGLQTEAPLKRAIMPNGGLADGFECAEGLRLRRRILTSWKRSRSTEKPTMKRSSTPTRRTYGAAAARIFSRGCRTPTGEAASSATTGASRCTESSGSSRRSSRRSARSIRPCRPMTIIRDREELSEQIRALNELKQMAAGYGFDISVPARNAREAVQWLYFGYLAAVKEQNGAAMSLGRTSTFLDIYFAAGSRRGRTH